MLARKLEDSEVVKVQIQVRMLVRRMLESQEDLLMLVSEAELSEELAAASSRQVE